MLPRHPPPLQRMDEELPVTLAETGSYNTACQTYLSLVLQRGLYAGSSSVPFILTMVGTEVFHENSIVYCWQRGPCSRPYCEQMYLRLPRYSPEMPLL